MSAVAQINDLPVNGRHAGGKEERKQKEKEESKSKLKQEIDKRRK